MVWRRIFGGVGIGLLVLALWIAFLALWFYLPVHWELHIFYLQLAVAIVMPLLAGAFAAGKIGRQGMKYGAFTALLLWLCIMALWFWCLPGLLTLKTIGITGFGSLVLGMIGGLCGIHVAQIRKHLKLQNHPSAEDEPAEPKQKQ